MSSPLTMPIPTSMPSRNRPANTVQAAEGPGSQYSGPVDVKKLVIEAGLDHPGVTEFIQTWAGVTEPADIRIISAKDEARLIAEALEDGELLTAAGGNYYARSHPLDTARSEQRTVVATSRTEDAGVYNNWRAAKATKSTLIDRMRGASSGKTMYVIPYLMAVSGTPLTSFGAGIELTDDRVVVLQMMRMARVGAQVFSAHAQGENFVRGVHVTGDLDHLGQGTADDARLFATIPDERLILHYGSAYGGNALLGKIAHGLRQAAYDGWATESFLAEQFMLLGITDHQTGKTYHICGGFPSASGKTNLAMTLAPEALGERYSVQFYGDDIAWLWVGEDGRLYGMNPENGAFGVAPNTNRQTNPVAMDSIGKNTGTIFTNVARHDGTGEVWWEGKTKNPPADVTGWRDWRGNLISERTAEQADEPWAHPNSRFTTTLANILNLAADANDPAGVPIDAIIFGGRTRDREPLIRAFTDPAEGVYDGLTLGAEATFAAEGVDGQLRYDPMSMRPFMSYREADYARHWLNILDQVEHKPVFAHVNWFARDAKGEFLWPGFRENLRALLWLLDFQSGRAQGVPTPVGVIPTVEELNLEDLELPESTLRQLLSIDQKRWQEEMEHRAAHLAQFEGLPEEIWAVHNRISKQLDS